MTESQAVNFKVLDEQYQTTPIIIVEAAHLIEPSMGRWIFFFSKTFAYLREKMLIQHIGIKDETMKSSWKVEKALR